MRVVVLNYTGNRDNWGCQATSRSFLDFLRKEVFPAATDTVATVDYPGSHWFDDDIGALYGERIKSIFASRTPARADLLFLESLARERFGSQFETARSGDVFIFQGEGSIGPSYQYRSVRLFVLPFIAKHLWGKPVLAVNQTLYANSDQDAASLRFIMGSFDLVAVREAMSLQFARTLGLPGVVLCPDMAFRDSNVVEAASAAGLASLPNHFFCVTGSAAIKQYSLEAFAAVVRQIAERHGLAPVLIASTKKDNDFSQRLMARLGGLDGRILSATTMPDVRSVYPVLAAAAFVMGGRYHTIVSALSVGTPALILPSNTYKCEGIGPMLGLDIPVHDLGAPDEIFAAAGAILADRAAISEGLRRKRRELDGVFTAFARLLQERVEGRSGQWDFRGGQAGPIAVAPRNQQIYNAHNEDEPPSSGALETLRHRGRLALARRSGVLRRSIARDMDT